MSNDYTNIHSWVEPINGENTPYLQLPCNFLKEKAFISLTFGERLFYLTLCIHKESIEQQACLEKCLERYNELLDLGMTEHDIKCEAQPYRKMSKYVDGRMFVIPEKQLEKYGFSAQYASKLKKSLIEKGFIEILYGKKGRYDGWNKNITIYRFSDKWKSEST